MNHRVAQSLARLAAQKPQADTPRGSRGPMPWEQDDGIVVDFAAAAERRSGAGRRRVLLAASLTVIAIAGSAVAVNQFSGSSTVQVATPPLLAFRPVAQQVDPQTLLRGLSAHARNQPKPRGSGDVLYVQQRSWSFTTEMGANGQDLGSKIWENLSEVWVRPDGTGRRAVRQQNPSPGGTPLTTDKSLRSPDQGPVLAAMSHDQLVAWFKQQGRDWNAAAWLNAINNWSVALDYPAVASAFLEVLADQPGLSLEGDTVDRSGRQAVAVSAVMDKPGDWFPKQRVYLLCDPNTGLPLAVEHVALTVDSAAVQTSVQVPTPVYYMLWTNAAFVPDTNSRP